MSVEAPIRPSLTLQRRFDAPVRLVYDAWTKPDMLMEWFGPAGAKALHAETDVRVGGTYRMRFTTPDGEIHDVSGVYSEVEPEKKLAFTWRWITMPERESQMILLFRAEGDKTLLTLHHEKFADEQARDDHEGGWTGALDNLEAFLAGNTV